MGSRDRPGPITEQHRQAIGGRDGADAPRFTAESGIGRSASGSRPKLQQLFPMHLFQPDGLLPEIQRGPQTPTVFPDRGRRVADVFTEIERRVHP
jgi:hypothetical protein